MILEMGYNHFLLGRMTRFRRKALKITFFILPKLFDINEELARAETLAISIGRKRYALFGGRYFNIDSDRFPFGSWITIHLFRAINAYTVFKESGIKLFESSCSFMEENVTLMIMIDSCNESADELYQDISALLRVLSTDMVGAQDLKIQFGMYGDHARLPTNDGHGEDIEDDLYLAWKTTRDNHYIDHTALILIDFLITIFILMLILSKMECFSTYKY